MEINFDFTINVVAIVTGILAWGFIIFLAYRVYKKQSDNAFINLPVCTCLILYNLGERCLYLRGHHVFLVYSIVLLVIVTLTVLQQQILFAQVSKPRSKQGCESGYTLK